MTHDHKVRLPLSDLFDQISDRVVGGEVLTLLDLATGPEGGSDDLCSLQSPEFATLPDGDGTQIHLRQEGSCFLNLLRAFWSKRAGRVYVFQGGLPVLDQVESHLFLFPKRLF
jgi:hypothetical protein